MQAKASQASLVPPSPLLSYPTVRSGEGLDLLGENLPAERQDAFYWQQQYQKQLAYQAFTRQLTDEIRKSSDLSAIYKTALEGLNQLFGISQSAILRLKFWDLRQMLRVADRIPKTRVLIEAVSTAESNVFQSGASYPLPEAGQSEDTPPPQIQSYWVSECVLTQAAMKALPEGLYLTNTIEFKAGLSGEVSPLLGTAGLPALMMIPLENKGKPLGFLVLQHERSRSWSAQEIDFAQLVAGQVSSAIIQTETLRQVESIVEDRTAQLQHSVDLQAKLYELNRKQIERLREMNKRMDEFLSTLSHELRTPLTSMMLAIRMLREAKLTPERRAQYLNILEQQCAQETSLINDLLALQELETKQVAMQLQLIDLPTFIRDLESGFVQRWASKGLTLEMDLPVTLALSTDVSSLNRVLLELLTNAGKYSDPSTAITLSVTQSIARQISIVITNLGGGISADELPYIFEKFRRCQGMTDNAVPGTGLGLALVKSLVQHLGGTVSATSKPIDEGTTYETSFKILLPKAPESSKGS
jgi:signal transduction histidine kinase